MLTGIQLYISLSTGTELIKYFVSVRKVRMAISLVCLDPIRVSNLRQNHAEFVAQTTPCEWKRWLRLDVSQNGKKYHHCHWKQSEVSGKVARTCRWSFRPQYFERNRNKKYRYSNIVAIKLYFAGIWVREYLIQCVQHDHARWWFFTFWPERVGWIRHWYFAQFAFLVRFLTVVIMCVRLNSRTMGINR